MIVKLKTVGAEEHVLCWYTVPSLKSIGVHTGYKRSVFDSLRTVKLMEQNNVTTGKNLTVISR